MKKLLFLTLLCLAFGCSNKKEIEKEIGVDWMDISSAPMIDVPIESLPAWLVSKINEYEAMYGENSIACVKIFRGTLKKQTVYFIFNVNSSCLLCEVYYDDGNKIDYFDSSGLAAESKNWVLIYKISCTLWDGDGY